PRKDREETRSNRYERPLSAGHVAAAFRHPRGDGARPRPALGCERIRALEPPRFWANGGLRHSAGIEGYRSRAAQTLASAQGHPNKVTASTDGVLSNPCAPG